MVLTRFAIERFLHRLACSGHADRFVLKGALLLEFHAMVELGDRNSRLRDFFDVDCLAMHRASASGRLVEPLRATFEPRGRSLPVDPPVALTRTFACSAGKVAQWRAFQERLGPRGKGDDLDATVARVAQFLLPVLEIAHGPTRRVASWIPGGPWRDLES